MDKLAFTMDNGKEQEFFVMGMAKVGDDSYILVTEEEEGDSDALILKEISEDGTEAVYELVEDDNELSEAMEALKEVISDVDIEL